jgi:hypothetical protein
MEKYNINFNGGSNIMKTLCWILSLISWLLLIITGIIGLVDLFNNANIWVIPKWETVKDSITFINVIVYYFFYRPMQILDSCLVTIFILTLIFTVLGFFIYVYLCTCGQNSGVMEGMLGPISRFHFIPLACASALYLIGITDHNIDETKSLIIASLVFSIIGLLTLVLIAFKSNLESGPWYANLIIKKGVYGSYIALFTYNTCYSILLLGIMNEKDPISFKKGCGIGLSLAVGIVNLIISFLLKDMILAFQNFLIYLGATIYYFGMHKLIREHYNENADGIIDIIMIVLSLAAVGFIGFQNKDMFSHK